MTYKKLFNIVNKVDFEDRVQRLSDSVFIPFDPENTDYQEYLKWLDEGNTPLPADEPNEGTE